MKKARSILKIGVTGGIGSGKTAVCTIFIRLGVPVLFADKIAKELSNSDPNIRKKLSALLGSSAYLSDGTLNSSFIAAQIFSNNRLQRQVEAIIHPRVEAEIGRLIDELQRKGHRLVIIEAALIFEAGLDRKLDAVVVVDTEKALRVQRVQQRDRSLEDDIHKRIRAQMDTKKKIIKADYIIRNNNSIKELEMNVQFLYSIFNKIIK
jgi:dephospho-CoA kinase